MKNLKTNSLTMTCSKVLSKNGNKKFVIIASVGIILGIVGVAFLLSFPSLYKMELAKQTVLLEDTVIYKMWQDIPIPIFQKVYFYNITNAHDVIQNKATPIVVEVGPYTYRSHWIKKDIAWHPNKTISYKEIKTFRFLRNSSVGGEDDNITTLNAPLLTAISMLKKSPFYFKFFASLILEAAGEGLFVTKNVSDLTYTGYKDLIMRFAPILQPGYPNTDGRFAWLYGKNATDDGEYTVFTGEGDIEKLNVINDWNGSSTLNFWKGKSCNMLNGTNGEISPPIFDSRPFISVFQSFFCRSVNLYYEGTTEYYGITSHRFKATKATIANGTENPDNACFDTALNLMSGAWDISACQHGAPAVLSLPHFCFADPSYLNFVKGVKLPNASRDGFYLDIEPNTGVTVGLAARFQVNMFVEKMPFIAQLNAITRNMVFPVLWTEIYGSLTEDLADQFRTQLQRPQVIVHGVCYSLIAVGILLIITAVVLFILARNHKTKERTLTDDEDDPLLDPGRESHFKTSYTDEVAGEGVGPEKSDPAGRDI